MVPSKKKKVCVVGAGVSGLVSARELRREGHDVTVMEQNSGVGGQWLYDPTTDAGDTLGVAGATSSIYASLRLNSPRDGMSFSDFFPFYPNKDGTGDPRRYPGHAEFLRYIHDYCHEFGLMDVVRLNTKVLHVALAPSGDDDDGIKQRWTVRWSSRRGDDGTTTTKEEEEVFDAVVVAVGQYTHPRLPSITGMDKWSRRQLHSHSYRVPDSFHGEVVVIVGFRESGKDIALELCRVAREVHVSVKSMDDIFPGVSKAVSRHQNLHLHLQIECLCEDGQVVFADGSRVVADSIIYCTGYDLSFPFLDTGGLVTVDDDGRAVSPLFEHTFPPALAPSLSFVGLPRLVLFPRFFETQARWVAQVLSDRVPLPSAEEMLRATEEYHRAREEAGVPRRFAHTVFFDMDYCDEFGARCGFPPVEEWEKELMWSSVKSFKEDDAESYRDTYQNGDVVGDGGIALRGLAMAAMMKTTASIKALDD